MARGLRQVFTSLIAGLFGPAIMAAESGMVELPAPRRLRTEEGVHLQITTSLPRGARLTVRDEQGNILGAVTPFGLPRGSTTATIPIPRSVITDQRVRLHLEVSEPHAPTRPPRQSEIERLELHAEPE